MNCLVLTVCAHLLGCHAVDTTKIDCHPTLEACASSATALAMSFGELPRYYLFRCDPDRESANELIPLTVFTFPRDNILNPERAQAARPGKRVRRHRRRHRR